MTYLTLRKSTPVNVIIIISGLLVSGFLMFFGLANLMHPDVSDEYLAQNTKVCLALCGLGLLPLLLAIAAFRGILVKKKDSGVQKTG